MTQTLKHISFKNRDIDLAADLRLPDEFDESSNYAALVIVTPGSSVKEQVGAVYGEKLTARGFVTITFDASYQGQSGGKPRDLEDPAARVEDVRCAVDYLMTLPYVEANRVGVLGVCNGGGYAVNAAMTEHRLKAVGTVVAVNMGRAWRSTALDADAIVETLEEVGKQRTSEARGGKSRREPWIPNSMDEAKAAGITDPDTLDAVDFYANRRPSDTRTNRLLFHSNGALMGFDAFHLVGELLTQPLQVIVGGRLGTTFSFQDGKTLFERATNKEDFLIIDGAGHYDLYDKDEYVDQAIERLDGFYKDHLS
ncbi:alpha/beta hydrolase [Novosphingopyxis sp.]|uniref:alpha/beta hydrolase n=1 Tax=Novosphingopyxis sp. TaxID=2709690 RepID=UPI003B5C212A